MAITVTSRGSVHSATDADPIDIASVAITSGKVYLILVATSIASGDAPSVSSIQDTGGGSTLSCTKKTTTGDAETFAARRVELWYGKAGGSGTVTIRVDLSGSSTQSDVDIWELDGVDTGGTNGANAIPQAVCDTNGGTSTTSLAIGGLAAFANGGNRPFAFILVRANEAITHDTGGGYTELRDAGHNSPSAGFCVQWHESDNSDRTPGFSWTTSAQNGGIAVELAIAAGSTLEVPSATLTLDEQVPTLRFDTPVPSATLTLDEQVPTLAESMSVPSTTLTLTGQVPTLAEGTSLEIPSATMTLTGQVPALVEGTALTVPDATLTLTGHVPSLVEGTVLTVPDATLTLTGQIPALSESAVLTVPDATLTLDEQAPTLRFDVPVPSATLTLDEQVPALRFDTPVPNATLTLVGQAPTLSSGSESAPVALRAAQARSAVVEQALLRAQQLASIAGLRRARRTLAVHGPSVVGPVIVTSSTPRVVLQTDFVNIVEEPSIGAVEIEVVRDADGKMRFYVVP